MKQILCSWRINETRECQPGNRHEEPEGNEVKESRENSEQLGVSGFRRSNDEEQPPLKSLDESCDQTSLEVDELFAGGGHTLW